MLGASQVSNRFDRTPPPPAPPVDRAATSPVQAGDAARRGAELDRLQVEDFPAYVRELRTTLAPQDRDNPFAYSLDRSVPIEVKRQVLAEYQSGQNAPRTEVTGLGGNNATYTPGDGANGTIRVNADLLGNKDPARRGQMEAFATWGHMEEVGHWADQRAQTLMGNPAGDSRGDEGARYALLATGQLAGRQVGADRIARYDLPASDGVRTIDVDTTVLKALAAEKLSNGSFARENRIGDVEQFGPEGHYQTTYITAAGAAAALGMPAAEADQMANRLALGSQLPDMLHDFDATSQFLAKLGDTVADGANGPSLLGPSWTREDQQHLESVYEGLHALPRGQEANAGWQRGEKAETAGFIRERIAAGDYVTAGVAIHRYGDLHAHVKPDSGLPYSGDLGHGLAGHTPDYLYTDGANGRAAPWSKAIDYQASLSNVIADGLVGRQQALGRPVAADAAQAAATGGRTAWRGVYDGALAASRSESHWFGADGANKDSATETWFRNSATAFIDRFHQQAGGRYAPLALDKAGVDGGYRASPGEVNSLNTVMDRFDARP